MMFVYSKQNLFEKTSNYNVIVFIYLGDFPVVKKIYKIAIERMVVLNIDEIIALPY